MFMKKAQLEIQLLKTFLDNVSIKQKPICWSLLPIIWLVFMWFWTLIVNGLNSNFSCTAFMRKKTQQMLNSKVLLKGALQISGSQSLFCSRHISSFALSRLALTRCRKVSLKKSCFHRMLLIDLNKALSW